MLAVRVAVEMLATHYEGAEPPSNPLLGKEGAVDGSEAARALLMAAMTAARDAIEAEAGARGVAPRELATTLILLLATYSGIAVAQVGDGAAVAAGADGIVYALTVPPNAEYANETTFLTSPHALETAQITLRHGPVARIALFTDGLQRVALRLPEGTPHPPFFTPLLRFVAEAADSVRAHEQLTAFLNSPRLTERTDDDLTLLLASLEAAE
jgi:hypothetical protein